MASHHSIVIAGGGSAGLAVAARLLVLDPSLDVAVIEPSLHHYYQPLWTLVGAGVFDKEETRRPEAAYMPKGVTWIRDGVAELDPEKKRVGLKSGGSVGYDQLVVALGMQLDWGKIDGLDGHLGTAGICSNYSYETVDSTWRFLREFSGGNMVFTFPSTPIKCAGAPQKIMYLADDHLRKRGVRDKSTITYAAAGAAIFGVKHYREALEPVVARKGIDTRFRHDLVAVRPQSREAVFNHLDEKREVILPYDFLHVVPPQSAPDVVKKSPLADAAGWAEAHKHTLQSPRFPDVFALGDNSSLPTSRTGAAIRKQAPVLVENLVAHRASKKLTASYDGYASCPLVTGYGKLILAEFDYDGKPAESFPFDQTIERFSMYMLKAYGLPDLYWNGMLRGRV